jgi:DNA-binding MarR family transcriptional regulator
MQDSTDKAGDSADPLPASWREPTSDGHDLAMRDFPSVLLVGASTLLQRNLTRPALEPHELGVPEWRVLAFLHENGRSAAGDMSNRMWMDKAQISRVLEALIERELVRREGDPNHRQRLFMELTAKGQRRYAQALESTRRIQSELLLALTPSERKGLYAGLKKLLRIAEGQGLPATTAKTRRNA